MAESHRDEIAKLEALCQSNPGGRSFTHLAEAYRKAGELEVALDVVERGLRRHSDYASAHVVLGRIFLDLKRPDEAADAFGRVLQLDPENLVALRAQGDLARDAGRAADALHYYRQLRALDPSDEALEEQVARLEGAATAEPETPAQPEISLTPPSFASDEPAPQPYPAQSEPEPAQPSSPWGYDPQPFATSLPGQSFGAIEPLDHLMGDLGDLNAGAMSDDTPPFDLSSMDLGGGRGAGFPEPEPLDLVHGIPFLESPGEPAPEPAGDDAAAEPPFQGADTAVPGDDAAELFVAGANWEVGEVTDAGEVVTETMAELYRRQGLLGRAAEVYRALLNDRPGDERLEARLAEVEAELAGGPPAPAAPPAMDVAEATTEAPAEAAPAAPEYVVELAVDFELEAGPESFSEAEPLAVEEIEAAWTGGNGAVADERTPYIWEDEGEEEAGPSIGEYFGALLSWRSAVLRAEERESVAPAAPAVEPVEAAQAVQEATDADDRAAEAAVAETTADTEASPEPFAWEMEMRAPAEAEAPGFDAAALPDPADIGLEPLVAGESAGSQAEAAALEPTAEEPLPAEPVADEPLAHASAADETAGAEGAPAAAGELDWLFGPEGVAAEEPRASAEAEQSAAPVAESEPAAPQQAAATEDTVAAEDDDLEMFRAWLQSLKR